MVPAIVLVAFLAAVIFLVLFSFGPSKKKTTVNQPPSFPLLGCFVSYYRNRHRLLDWYTELLSRSPTRTILINRLGSNSMIVTANPANVEYILKTRFHNYPKGKPFTDVLSDLLGRGIFNVDGDLWHQQRKVASHEFTTRSLRDYALKTVTQEAHDRLLPFLRSACISKTCIDLQETLNRFNFDTVCKLSFDMDPQCLLPSMPACPLAQAFEVAAAISAKRGASLLPLIWRVKRMLRIGSELRLRKAIDMVHESVMEMIRQKKGTMRKGDRDLLSRFLSISAGKDGDDELARDMVISFLMAGRDTTSATLTWFFWLMARHPDVQEQVVMEIARVGDEQLDFDGIKELKFLKACLRESLRLFPPVSWDSKHAQDNDRLPDGTSVRKGTRVTYFPYGMGRMTNLWGEDCLKYKPERWLSAAEGREELLGEPAVSPYKFPIFQAGPRVCLGKDLAYMEMAYIAAFVLRRFEFKLADMKEPRFVPFLTARMEGGLPVFVEERKVTK